MLREEAWLQAQECWQKAGGEGEREGRWNKVSGLGLGESQYVWNKKLFQSI
jgi:hypothetical protein